MRRLLFAAALGVLTTLSLAWIAPIALYGALPFKWYRTMPASIGEAPSTTWSTTLLRDHIIAFDSATGYFSGGSIVRPTPSWYPKILKWDGAGMINTDATGFPFRAVSCEAGYVSAANHANYDLKFLRGGIELSRTSDRFGIMPFRPIWPGLIADIAIWSAAWCLLLAGIGAIRQWRKRRMIGRCAKCRYDLRGLPANSLCPECGQATAKR